MSNEAKMSLEEKLVQRIKNDTLMAAVGDEDMLTDLVKRALHEALFQERTVSDGYYRTRTEPSLVIQEAKAVVRPACEKIAQEMFAEIVARPEVRAEIEKAVPLMVVDALRSAVAFGVQNVITEATNEAELRVRTAVQGE